MLAEKAGRLPLRRLSARRRSTQVSADLYRQSGKVLRVRGSTRPQPGDNTGKKVDARSERWREHRKKVRGEIVEAAFRAIDRLGPEVSVREIAAEAGTAKPKIYRHFADKSDLFRAVGVRLRDMLWAAIFSAVDFVTDPIRDVVRHSVQEYVDLVDQHPNVVRFFVQGDVPQPAQSTTRTLNEGREITLAIAEMFNNELREMELDRAALELAAFAAFGSAASATDWWLGPDRDSPRRMPREAFVAHLATIMMGVIAGTAELLGIQLDPDRPIHEAIPRQRPVA